MKLITPRITAANENNEPLIIATSKLIQSGCKAISFAQALQHKHLLIRMKQLKFILTVYYKSHDAIKLTSQRCQHAWKSCTNVFNTSNGLLSVFCSNNDKPSRKKWTPACRFQTDTHSRLLQEDLFDYSSGGLTARFTHIFLSFSASHLFR